MYARGAILGLTRGSNKAHIIRAALESIAYQTKDLMDTMEKECKSKIKNLKADGGASGNNFLMQFQSDICNIKVSRPIITETTALGAAYLAGLAVGFWKDKEEVKKFWHMSAEFQPKLESDKVNKYYNAWKKAVKRTLNWEEE